MPSRAGEITQLLRAWNAGDLDARDQLMPLVFDDLRKIARRYYSKERQGHTLQPTALVNELYMRLSQQRRQVPWRSREEFFAVSAKVIRHILVDYARRRSAEKRGGAAVRVAFDESLGLSEEKTPVLIALDDALGKLAKESPRSAQVVELHAFGGLTFDEIANVLGLARSTVMLDWKFARLWLRRRLRSEPPTESP